MAPVKKTAAPSFAKATNGSTRTPKSVEKKGVAPASSSPALEAITFSMEGKKVGVVALPIEIFGAPWRADLVHQVTTAMQANLRQNRAHTKDRAEVSGGGKKPWKQKGTGQARHSSNRSPIWRHGGVTFGPRSTRDYSEKINKKMRAQALISVLSRKLKEGEIIFVDKLSFATPKTAAASAFIAKLAKGADHPTLATKRKNAALFAMSSYDTNVLKSFRNLGNMMTEEVRSLNPVAILSHKYLVIENPEAAFKALTGRTK